MGTGTERKSMAVKAGVRDPSLTDPRPSTPRSTEAGALQRLLLPAITRGFHAPLITPPTSLRACVTTCRRSCTPVPDPQLTIVI